MKYFLLTAIILSAFSVKLLAQSKIDSIQLLKDAKALTTINSKFEKHKSGNINHYVLQRFKESGIQPSNKKYQQSFNYKKKGKRICGNNFIGKIKGASDSAIIISTYSTNSSGVAALIAIGNYFKPSTPKYTLLFLVLAEDGDDAFIKKPPVLLNKIKLVMSIGKIENNGKGELSVIRYIIDPQMEKTIDELNTKSSLHIKKEEFDIKENITAGMNKNLQYLFVKSHIPFLDFYSEENYKSPIYSKINPLFFYRAVQIINDLLSAIEVQNDFLKNQIPPRSEWIIKSGK